MQIQEKITDLNGAWEALLNALEQTRILCEQNLEAQVGLIFVKNLCAIQNKKAAKIRNRYNQAPQLTQDTNGKVTNSQLDTTNESKEVSPFPAGDHKASTKGRAQKHNKHKTEIT